MFGRYNPQDESLEIGRGRVRVVVQDGDALVDHTANFSIILNTAATIDKGGILTDNLGRRYKVTDLQYLPFLHAGRVLVEREA